MSIDDAISPANTSFGIPVNGRGPGALLRKLRAKLLWPFLRHQVDFNHAVIAELRDVRAAHEALRDAVHQHAEVLAIISRQLSDDGHFPNQMRQIGGQIDFVEDGLHNVERALHILEKQYTDVAEQRESHLRDVQSHLSARTQQLENQIDLGQRQLLARFYDGFGALQRDVTDLTRQFAELSEEAKNGELRRDVTDLNRQFSEFSDEAKHGAQLAETDISRKMASVLARMAEVDHFLTEVKRSYPEMVKPERLTTLATGFDALARAHAARFRGTPEEIRERVSVYVPELKSVVDLGPVLDIGCGNGELLEVLAENEIPAYGIDMAESAVAQCVARGLDARADDALHHLASVPAGSLGAVTALHVVEHLDTDTLIEMIDLSLRALRPGGLLVLETPNPGNVLVGANFFYLDPTHERPVPSALLEFLVSIRGFAEAHVVPLRRSVPLFDAEWPGDVEWQGDVHRVAAFVSEGLLGAEDYAVIAHRAR